MTLAYVPPAIEIPADRGTSPGDRCPGSGCPDNAQPKGDRGSGRGPGTVAYRVWFAGYQVVKGDNGEPISNSFITDHLVLDVPSGGAFGFGEQTYINDWVALNLPGMTVMDAKTLAAEFAEF